MNQTTQALEHASVRQYCKVLRMPVIGSNFVWLSEQAIKEQRSHIGYLEALLAMEAEERDRHAIQKRIRDAKLPRLKTLEEFDFNQAHQIPAAKIRELAEGGYIERAEPVVFMGECGTGKTHLATGLCVAACRQKRRARFTTAANLVNELVEARQQNAVKRVLVRWLRYDVIVLDEVGYVPLADIGAGVLVSGDRGASRARDTDRDHEPAIFRMDAGISQSALVQSPAGSHHRPGAHHRDRNRVISFPQNLGGAAEKESFVASVSRASTELSRGRDSDAVPSSALHPGFSCSVISKLEEKDSYDVGGAK